MANHCSNYIRIWGEPQDIQRFKEQFLGKFKTEPNFGHLPLAEGCTLEDFDRYQNEVMQFNYRHYIFDADICDSDEINIAIACWTKWSPPISEMMYACEHFKLGCNIGYDETGMGLFGEWQYDKLHGQPNYDVSLDEMEMSQIEYLDEEDCYIDKRDNTRHESESQLYQDMLDAKIQRELISHELATKIND